MNKVTIKDIAKAAGVSIATVSYVINENPKQSISEETKRKVLQWVNILNYVPNASAVALTTSKTNTIVFISSTSLSYLQKLDLMNFLELFSLHCAIKGYRVVFTYQMKSEVVRNADAIVCYNMDAAQFYEIGNINTVPMIAVDMVLNDDLFYQINKDYQQTLNEATLYFKTSDFTLITIEPKDHVLKDFINSIYKSVIYITKLEDVVTVLDRNKQNNIVLFDYFLKNIFEATHPSANVFYFSLRNEERFKVILSSIELAINREVGHNHFIKI